MGLTKRRSLPYGLHTSGIADDRGLKSIDTRDPRCNSFPISPSRSLLGTSDMQLATMISAIGRFESHLRARRSSNGHGHPALSWLPFANLLSDELSTWYDCQDHYSVFNGCQKVMSVTSPFHSLVWHAVTRWLVVSCLGLQTIEA